MSPQQLLRETQRAAGDRNLESWHQILIEDGAEFKKILEARPLYMTLSRGSSLFR